MNRIKLTIAIGLTVLLAVGAAKADTVTVTTVSDTVDINWQTATIADLPGPDGVVSLSEAMIATNNTPGHDTVAFAIPASELGWFGPQYEGVAVFHALTGFYWRANDEVTIDGTTQTAFAGDTNTDGAEVLLYGNEFYLNDNNSTLCGLHGTAVQSGGANSLIEGNTGGMNLTLFGGGGTTVRNNECGTIKIDRSNNNVVIGNTAQRVRVLGGGGSQLATNNRIGGPTLAERNYLTGYGTVNSEGLPAGAAVQLAWTRGTLIENNWIGTTTDGLAQGNLACTMGVSFETENHDVTVRDNLIAGILGHGQGPHHAGQLFGWAIYFWGSTTNIQLIGNTIGLDANGDPTLGSVWGVNVDNYAGYTVAGVAIEDNVIAGHIFNGVRVGPTAIMRLSGNSIYDNGWIGIDLIPDNFSSDVSLNDALDADTGGNGVQNFPDIAAATRQGGSVEVIGSLHSSPSSNFTIEFFASPECDASGFGQGQEFLGSTGVTTDAAGDADFDVFIAASIPDGWVMTSTATLEPIGATSEFSACVSVGGVGLSGDLDGDGDVDLSDLAILLSNYPCSGGGCSGDVDGDGATDLSDLAALLTNYGT